LGGTGQLSPGIHNTIKGGGSRAILLDGQAEAVAQES
jgi:hypothetical protein